jgi:2-polyprenyl-3-methyl-5-hydroxy-6-metoxy-1,4-benzoquinol methylase
MKLQEEYNKKARLYEENINMYVVKHVDANKKILDVGCSVGELGKYLKRYKNAEVYGIDISNKAIQKATKILDGAFVVNIDTDKIPFAKKKFDEIICADVLEHLYDPVSVLKKLSSYLKDDGIFILSIPNVANIKIRLNLLLGRFDYTDKGILDNSHIRFFTRKTVNKLIKDSDLILQKYDYTPGFSFFLFRNLDENNIVSLRHRMKYFLTSLIPSLFCAQHIVIARKKVK